MKITIDDKRITAYEICSIYEGGTGKIAKAYKNVYNFFS
jgi:hypothetical protein